MAWQARPHYYEVMKELVEVVNYEVAALATPCCSGSTRECRDKVCVAQWVLTLWIR